MRQRNRAYDLQIIQSRTKMPSCKRKLREQIDRLHISSSYINATGGGIVVSASKRRICVSCCIVAFLTFLSLTCYVLAYADESGAQSSITAHSVAAAVQSSTQPTVSTQPFVVTPSAAGLPFYDSLDALDAITTLTIGEKFSAAIENITTVDGATTTQAINCQFVITSDDTCEVIGAGTRTGYTAIDEGTSGKIIIPASVTYQGVTYKVTSIGLGAFGGAVSAACDALTEVELPSSIETIDSYAFAYCSSLKTINFPDQLATIRSYAFAQCYALGEVRFPQSLTIIEQRAFYCCENITQVSFPASLTRLGTYAFCNANALKTVIFEGDAPDTGLYAFTGGTEISKVIYRAKPLSITDNRFNSEKVEQPTYYYTITFYPSKDAASAHSGALGRITVSEKLRLMRLNATPAPDADEVYDGSVPAFPAGTNVWRYEKETDRGKTPTSSQSAWPEQADIFDLSNGGSVEAQEALYRGESILLYADDPKVSDKEEVSLDVGIDYEITYQRQNSAGVWVDTADTTTIGTLRVTITGRGLYSGTVTTTFDISLKSGCTFITNVSTLLGTATGTDEGVRCAFKVISLDESSKTGTLSVSPKLSNKAEIKAKVTLMAVPSSYTGGVKIPETVSLFGYTFTVTEVNQNAFSSNKEACALSGIDFPATITTLGYEAFSGCNNLQTIVFRGDANNIAFSNRPFNACKSIKTVVFYGKHPDNSLYSLKTCFPSDNDVTYYYTVTFYESADAVGKSEPLAKATLRDDVLLCSVPDKPKEGLYDGEIPDYPSSLIDDTNNDSRSWYAPTWVYPEVNEDTALALRSTLTDSVYAYAQQRQDAFSVEYSIITGVEDTYAYTGSDVISANNIKVYSDVGGLLKLNTDYNVVFQIYDDWTETWSDASSTIASGKYRVYVTGAGKYANSTRSQSIEFSVEAQALALGETFSAQIPLRTSSGTDTTVSATFEVTGIGSERSVSIVSKNNVTATIPDSTNGEVTVLESVSYGGLSYQVTGIGEEAFSDCTKVKAINLPDSIISVSKYAFSGCTALEQMDVPAGVSNISTYAFENCTSLKSVALHEGLKSIETFAFSGCASLSVINLPEGLESCGEQVFSGCNALKTIEIPASLQDCKNMFNSSGIESAKVKSGTTTLPEGIFTNATYLTTVELPSSLTTIGKDAFKYSALSTIEITSSITSIDEGAFSFCNSLKSVIFDGNPNDIDLSNVFSSSRYITAVVYCGLSLVDPSQVFSNSAYISYYSAVSFYESEKDLAAGKVYGTAYIKHGTQLYTLVGGNPAEGVVFGKSMPELPVGCNAWSFGDDVLATDTIDGPTYAVATTLDLTDLSNANFITEGGYRYTGSTINPVTKGTAIVVLADGTKLTRGMHYTTTIERQQKDGTWKSTYNYASVGNLRIIATAVEGSGYTGSVIGYYSISRTIAGDIFTANDENGNTITYLITKSATAAFPGEVQVGTGDAAVSQDTKGSVVIPEQVSDPSGSVYVPTTIGARAFYRCMQITSISIPSGIDTICDKAFAYESVKTDTATSNLSTVVFNNDMTQLRAASNIFLNCDVIKTIVYKDKRGTYEQLHPLSLRGGITCTHYYTLRFYEDAESANAKIEPLATAILKEGAYVDSVSATEYYEGSDKVPEAGDGFAWAYEDDALDADGRIIDSLNAVKHEVQDNTITAMVALRSGTGDVQVPCTFSVLSEPAEGKNGTVAVGRLEDGKGAVAQDTKGTIVIPSTVSAKGATYDVVSVGAFAFGASEASEAAVSLSGIELPISITAIEQGAFMNCTGLVSVGGLENCALTTVGAGAFSNCMSLTSVVLPESLTDIQASAFTGAGLVRVELPSALSKLGKRAFSDCKSLQEVVFGGAYELDLPALDSASSEASGTDGTGNTDGATAAMPAADTITRTSTTSALTILDDYVFANCSSLKRVSFELDVSALAVSSVAFENVETLSTLVFGAAKADFTSTAIKAQEYYTINYFNQKDEVDTASRLGYLCLPAQSDVSDLAQASAYCGSVAELPEHYEWVTLFDTSAPFADSGSAYRQKIAYKLDTSEVDAAFSLSFVINDEVIDASTQVSATYGDAVRVSAQTAGALKVTSMKATNLTTGAEIASAEFRSTGDSGTGTSGEDGADTTGEDGADTDVDAGTGDTGIGDTGTSDDATLSFSMPASAVGITLTYNQTITITIYSASGAELSPVTVDLATLESIAATHSTTDAQYAASQNYSAWDESGQATLAETSSYVTLAEFFEAANVRFDAGDSIILESSTTGEQASFTYNDLYSEEHLYYPHIDTAGSSDASIVEPVFAIKSAVTSAKDAHLTPSLKGALRLLTGQTSREFSKGRATSENWFADVDTITVLSGAEEVSGCTIFGLDDYYVYTGERILPEVTVTDIDGNTMTEGSDYTLTYGENIEAGKGSITISGMGFYTGEYTVEFRIIRAKELSGNTAVATSAAIALEAYPQGSAGAIIATVKNFPDALSASALAGALGYPILLTSSDALSAETADALSALSIGKSKFRIFIMGGEGAVSSAVSDALLSYVPNKNYLSRLAGNTRYATARSLCAYGMQGGLWGDTAIVATGENFPDALSIAPFAAWSKSPVLLCAGDAIDTETLDMIREGGFTRVVILGGTSAVGAQVESLLSDMVGASNVVRLSGTDRYATSARVAQFSLDEGMSADGAAIATGTNFPDGLSGAALLGQSGSIMLLANNDNTSALSVLVNEKDNVSRLYFFGGTGAVSESVRTLALNYLAWPKEALK